MFIVFRDDLKQFITIRLVWKLEYLTLLYKLIHLHLQWKLWLLEKNLTMSWDSSNWLEAIWNYMFNLKIWIFNVILWTYLSQLAVRLKVARNKLECVLEFIEQLYAIINCTHVMLIYPNALYFSKGCNTKTSQEITHPGSILAQGLVVVVVYHFDIYAIVLQLRILIMVRY